MLMIILGLICLVLLIYSCLQRRQTRQLGEQLNAILDQEPTNQLMGQELTSQEVTRLVSAINRLLRLNRSHARLYHEQADSLQQSLTHLSHDLRTPLAALEGYLQLLEETDGVADRKRYQAILKQRLSHTRQLLEQYFLSLKYTAHDFQLSLVPIDPNELFLQCLLSFWPQFEARGLEPEIELIDHPIQIAGDREALVRIYNNLIQNGLHHGHGFFKVHSDTTNDEYVLTISNGLPDQQTPDHDRIFERFYKADSMRTTGSSGLGLSIVKSLVGHLHGRVDSGSRDGLFWIRLVFPLE